VDVSGTEVRRPPARLYVLSGLFSSAVLLLVFLLSRPFSINPTELDKLGHAQPFASSAEIAARTGIPLLYGGGTRPDNEHPYERLEQYSNDTDYDHLDAVFWDLLAMATDVRPTKSALMKRNYLLYLVGVWLFSMVCAWHHGDWRLHPLLFGVCSLLVFNRRVQTLLHADYLTQGTLAIAPIFCAAFLLGLCVLFARPGMNLRPWLIATPVFCFGLRYLSVIHSANRSVMLAMLVVSLPLIWLRFRPPGRMAAKLLLVAVLGVLAFDGVVGGLRDYRDDRMQFTHPRPASANHTTFSLFYYGIGSFDNALDLYPSDDIWWASQIESRARKLGVTIREDERALVGGAPKADHLFFRLWTSYVKQYPVEYLTNRVRANAWLVARLALRDIFPKLSPPEQLFWCVAGLLPWCVIGLAMWAFVRHRLPIEGPIVLISAFVPLAFIGIIHHPNRGMFVGMPVLLIGATVIVLLLLRILPLPRLRYGGQRRDSLDDTVGTSGQ
jgi:hypothetical protein